ncbi:hypothetical protein INR49_007686 [Caranx melampygus]|nr:hypothetical protein INR49_007686 [Caranx melampygus]
MKGWIPDKSSSACIDQSTVYLLVVYWFHAFLFAMVLTGGFAVFGFLFRFVFPCSDLFSDPFCSLRCNINVAFVLQMRRAESLKAGVGSRSKAAKPCPPPPSSVCYHACPCGDKRLFTEPDGTWSAWHMGHFTTLLRVDEHLCPPRTPRWLQQLTMSLLCDAYCDGGRGHLSREKWLPSLFCFSSLNQGNNRKILKNVVVTVFFFYKDCCGRLHCHMSFSVTDSYMCTSLYGLRLKCQCSAAKRAISNKTDDSFWTSSSTSDRAGPSSAQRHDHKEKKTTKKQSLILSTGSMHKQKKDIQSDF